MCAQNLPIFCCHGWFAATKRVQNLPIADSPDLGRRYPILTGLKPLKVVLSDFSAGISAAFRAEDLRIRHSIVGMCAQNLPIRARHLPIGTQVFRQVRPKPPHPRRRPPCLASPDAVRPWCSRCRGGRTGQVRAKPPCPGADRSPGAAGWGPRVVRGRKLIPFQGFDRPAPRAESRMCAQDLRIRAENLPICVEDLPDEGQIRIGYPRGSSCCGCIPAPNGRTGPTGENE
jgi:hypothetical protein